MTSQEEQMLNALVERVNSTQLSEKDMAAEALLARGFANNVDAVYILAQSVLVQNIALEQARAQLTQAREQVQQLEQQTQQPAKATSFLGGLLGHREPQPPPPPVQQSAYQPVYEPPQYQSPYNPAPPQYQAPFQGGGYPGQPYQGQPYGGPQYVPAPPSQPSFLRGAAQTAAGVAAGALAFEGVESLLHGGFGHPGMGMGMGGWGMPGVGFGMGPGAGYERPIEETVVNNYYDSPGGEHQQRFEHEQGNYGQDFDRGGEEHVQNAGWDDSGSNFDDNSGGASDFNENSDFGSGGGDDSGNF